VWCGCPQTPDPQVSPALDQVLDGCLTRSTDDRWSSPTPFTQTQTPYTEKIQRSWRDTQRERERRIGTLSFAPPAHKVFWLTPDSTASQLAALPWFQDSAEPSGMNEVRPTQRTPRSPHKM